MENRKAPKIVLSFAKKQWTENKPKSVEARRIKDQTYKKYGFPAFVIKARAQVKFVVCVEYLDALNMFQFSSMGEKLGKKLFDPPFDVKKEIGKKSKLIDKFPKKKLT